MRNGKQLAILVAGFDVTQKFFNLRKPGLQPGFNGADLDDDGRMVVMPDQLR